MATSSSRNTGPASVRRKARPASGGGLPAARQVQAWLEKAGCQPALPHAIFDAAGQLIAVNARMADLLGIKLPLRAPMAPAELAGCWPFFNEDMSSQALFRRLSSGGAARLDADPIVAETALKTYRLFTQTLSGVGGVKGRVRLVVAELVRRGDLLQDAGSRQALFRSLSHEIRSSVLALKGYLDMLEPRAAREKEIRDRMAHALKRLEGVVHRLEEFKSELGVEL